MGIDYLAEWNHVDEVKPNQKELVIVLYFYYTPLGEQKTHTEFATYFYDKGQGEYPHLFYIHGRTANVSYWKPIPDEIKQAVNSLIESYK